MEPVLDPSYWAQRIATCGGDLHRAMFQGSHDQFREKEDEQYDQLRNKVGKHESVLDAGCGYGRLLRLLDLEHWKGTYLGVDICPQFVQIARLMNPGRALTAGDLRDLRSCGIVQGRDRFDVAVALWLREPVSRNCGYEVWEQIEDNLHLVAKRVVVVS